MHTPRRSAKLALRHCPGGHESESKQADKTSQTGPRNVTKTLALLVQAIAIRLEAIAIRSKDATRGSRPYYSEQGRF